MNEYHEDDPDNLYSIMLVPYFTGKQLNVKIGMGFPRVDDPEDQTHINMVSALTLLAAAFRLMQEDDKLAKKLIKKSKEIMDDFSDGFKDTAPTTYLDEEKKVVKPSFKDKK